MKWKIVNLPITVGVICCLFSTMEIHLSSTYKWRDPDTGEGKDTFQVQIDFYRDRYDEEFQAILRDGVEYDEDGGGTVSDSEKEPLHNLRLVR